MGAGRALCYDGDSLESPRYHRYDLELRDNDSSCRWLADDRSSGDIPVSVCVRILYSQTEMSGPGTFRRTD